MRARGIGARIVPRASEIVVLQGPAEGTRATVRRVHVVAQMRALVLVFETLVDVLALTALVRSESLRALRVPAGETVLEKFHILRTGASVTSEDIDAFVGTVVLVLKTLVHI